MSFQTMQSLCSYKKGVFAIGTVKLLLSNIKLKKTGIAPSGWYLPLVSLVILLLFINQAGAQSQITLKGHVYDKETKEPLPFATVTIIQSQISVISNASGDFIFHIPAEQKDGVIQISFLGYKTIQFNVPDIQPGMIASFGIKQQVQQLPEVEIKMKQFKIPAEDIVDRAVRNIRKNYPRDKTLYYGYYRDYISPVWMVSYQNLMEAALVIEDRGFPTFDQQRTKIKLEQLRYNPEISIDTSLIQAYDGENKFIPNTNIREANELALLRAHDPIRNHKVRSFSFVYVFDYNFVNNHRFYYESITEEDSVMIYGIRFECDAKVYTSNSDYKVNGQIFIRSDNYAILKFNYTVTCNTPTYAGKFMDLKLEYKNYKDKYYLNYLSLMNYFVLKNNKSERQINKPYFQFRELFINHIVNEPFESLPPNEVIDKKASLLTNKIPVVEGFWDQYNYTGVTKLEEQAEY